MSEYQKDTAPPEDLSDFPGLLQEDLDAVHRRFTHYLFFENEKKGRKVWTTCCHREEFIKERGRTQTPGDRLVLSARHNEYVTCPYCSRVVYAKNRKLLKRGYKLSEYHAVVFLHVAADGNTVWAQGYWSTRDLMEDPTGTVLYKPTRVYRFQPGKAEQWDIGYYGGCSKRKHPKNLEPCIGSGIEPYIPVGLERLENSFLRYTGYAEPMANSGYEKTLWRERGLRSDLIRYLTAAARYPRQVELMQKAGCREILGDLVWGWKKNSDVIKWNETDPCKAFGLTKPELREFLAGNKKLDTLRILCGVRKLGGKMSPAEAEVFWDRIEESAIEVLRRAKLYDVPVNRLLRYLDSFTRPRCHGGGVTLNHVVRHWVDYIDMANQLGYDLSNPIWQMPRDLEQKHNELAAAVNGVKVAKLNESAKRRMEEAQKRYNFALDGWIIRAPVDGKEITAEGKALRHCVGGYADRHMKGNLTILFLRREDAPFNPYMTIEMQGNRLIQIHGYRNEAEPSPENPNCTDPRVLHKDLLDIWLDWVKKGSRRRKDGTPILPKKITNEKEKKTA